MLESEIHERQMARGLERPAAALTRVIADALSRVPPDEAPLAAWPFVCGSNVAHLTHATSYRDRVLRVEVPDRAWRTQLKELAPRYVAALNALIAQQVVRIQFTLPGEVAAEEPTSR
jgi:Dna[CI] antecedent, DciA